MPLLPPICLAAGDDSLVDVVVWLVAGAFWLIAQIHGAKKKQERQKKAAAAASAARPAGSAETPGADELAEIFKRLGANVPGTPPPAPAPQPAPAAVTRPPAKRPPRVSPAIAKRLARVQQEAAAAARRAEPARQAEADAAPGAGAGVHSQAGDGRATESALRRTGAILPRIGAMDLKLSAWPRLPLPGFAPVQQTGAPLRAKLRARREVRDALVAQTFLQPPKGAR
ncbi:MAG TPA: hypothetical protein P5204_13065 [Kiritimatiellia bacterium]|nr:hypothetical protein [Kiritimatiellia bacterium]